ncbi:hypothetical protein BGZ76_007058, partial [Entomortierella beljakovae]
AGFMVTNDDGTEGRTYFTEYTEAEQTAHQNRVVKLKALAWNTQADDVHAAMTRWGVVSSVTTGFNAKKTMGTAVVVFENEKSIQDMLDRNITSLVIGKDTAAVAQIGAKTVTEDRTLTKKLAHLPGWFTPADVLKLLDRIKTQDGWGVCQSVSMPVDPLTKRTCPEAFVYFYNRQQWELVKNKVFTIEGKSTMWIEPDQPTCRTCGHPNHYQRDCVIFQRRKEITAIRRVNTVAMKTTQGRKLTPPQMPAKTTKTQTSNRIAVTQSPGQAPSSQSTSRSTNNMSYSGILRSGLQRSSRDNTSTYQTSGVTFSANSNQADTYDEDWKKAHAVLRQQ